MKVKRRHKQRKKRHFNAPLQFDGEIIEVELQLVGARVDKALATAWPAFSRAQWQRWLKEGRVRIAGIPAKASDRVQVGEIAQAIIPPVVETDLIPEEIPLDIRYEDDVLLVVNKNAGMVVHPAVGHEQGTLVNAILHHCPDLPGINGEKRPGIVHRLDKDTSGLIVIAKTEQALTHLQAQFKARTVQKTYLALVDGLVQPPQALIDAPIGRDRRQRKKMAVIHRPNSAKARESQTSYETLATYQNHTLLACTPHTGRTHQIRVHLAYIGYPIVGDMVYGRRKQRLSLWRHFLHAHRLGFEHPVSGVLLNFEVAMPAELQKIISSLQITPLNSLP